MRMRIFLLLLVAVCLLTGCAVTVDQMYRLPKRPQSYNDLQNVMDKAMEGMEYSAPRSGENQQTVQMADLDGDGVREYLLFARSGSDKPLQILIFAQEGEHYALVDTVACNGASFDLVEYVQMDGQGGCELVVGCQLNDQVLRSVSVYTFSGGQSTHVLSANYSKFLTCDLDADARSELLVLRPGASDTDNGIAELYRMENGVAERTNEARMSRPADKLKRILVGNLHGGVPAVFVGSTVNETAIITDIYALKNGVFTNVSLSNESGTSVQTLRNYYVYADDIDDDGEVEIPSLIRTRPLDDQRSADRQHVIRWYAMAMDGSETDKLFTYHDFVGGWYLCLESEWAEKISVVREGNVYKFYYWDGDTPEKIFSVFALSGQNREEQAVQENRFVIHKGDSVVYAAHLEVASGALRLTQDNLINAFHLIRMDWKTGEM